MRDLTALEKYRLTGSKRIEDHIKWCEENGVNFILREIRGTGIDCVIPEYSILAYLTTEEWHEIEDENVDSYRIPLSTRVKV